MSATALTTTDVLDLCQQMLQRAGLSVAQLAKHAGKDLPMVETPPPKQPGQLAPRVAQTLAALDRLEGATLAELQTLGLQFVERVAQVKGEDAARQMRLLLGVR